MTAPFRAIRFVHPDLDEGAPGLSLSARGAMAMVEGTASIRQAVLLLLSTSPGERLMRPAYGCNLHQLVFSPNDDTTAGLAVHYVRRALEAWEPRVEVLAVDARPAEDDPGRLDIELAWRVRTTGVRDQLRLSLDLET
jgi:hypothetical protein